MLKIRIPLWSIPVMLSLLFFVLFLISWQLGVSLAIALFYSTGERIILAMIKKESNTTTSTISCSPFNTTEVKQDEIKTNVLYPQGQGRENKQDSKDHVWTIKATNRNYHSE